MRWCWLALLTACSGSSSGQADAGLPSEPVACSTAAGAEILGTLTTETGDVTFGTAQVQLLAGSVPLPGMLQLTSNTKHMEIYLSSVDPPPPVGDYTEAASLFPGAGMSLVADAQIVVDANNWPADVAMRCFAGRFLVTFGDHGTLAGWFRAP